MVIATFGLAQVMVDKSCVEEDEAVTVRQQIS